MVHTIRSTSFAILILFVSLLAGCKSAPVETRMPATQASPATVPSLPASTILPTLTPQQLSPTPDLSAYAFPGTIDPAKKYLFYLHGKIIEDLGLPAIDPKYGEYEYEAILKKLSSYGFVVISEPRPKNTDPVDYAKKVAAQVTTLLNAGVPARNITVAGASKGGGIAILVSHVLENKEINYVIMAICDPDTVSNSIQGQINLYGNVLSIYDSADTLAGSCRDLFAYSEGKGLSRHDEIVLNIGTGHGVLYKPLEAWIKPLIQWTGQQ